MLNKTENTCDLIGRYKKKVGVSVFKFNKIMAVLVRLGKFDFVSHINIIKSSEITITVFARQFSVRLEKVRGIGREEVTILNLNELIKLG